MDHKHMPLKFLEFGTSNDYKLLFCCCFHISITNVCHPKFEAAELCNEGKKADASEGHNVGVDIIKGFVCQVAVCH